MRSGRCTNFGSCATADTQQTVKLADMADLVCPECKRALTETSRSSQPGSPSSTLVLAATFLLLLLLCGSGYFLFKRLTLSPSTRSAASAPVPALPISGSVFLRLSGSNTIGSQLAPALAAAFLKQEGATGIQSYFGSEDSKVSGVFPDGNRVIEIHAHGSATAFTELASGSADIGMASRKINSAEESQLSALGDMTSPASEHVLGLDGIAVIVNRANPVASLSKEQIAGLFSGEIANWSGVSGTDGPVRVYARDAKSGTFDTFKSLVLKDRPLRSGAERFEDSQKLSDAVSNDVNAIGFVGLPYVASSKAVAVSEKGARALLPNRFTVSTEDYLLSRRLFLYTASNPKPAVRRFVDFALSKAGQDIVAANGFVEQNVRAESAAPAPASSPHYQSITSGAQRLSLDFRFRSGSSQLDNKALADLDRVTSFLSDLRYSGGSVMLLGFSDSTGAAAANVALSKDRAKAVADQFAQRGAQPGLVTGFGPEMPIAANDNEDGRQKNRRVEIWVRK